VSAGTAFDIALAWESFFLCLIGRFHAHKWQWSHADSSLQPRFLAKYLQGLLHVNGWPIEPLVGGIAGSHISHVDTSVLMFDIVSNFSCSAFCDGLSTGKNVPGGPAGAPSAGAAG